ncbi:MAG: hypothetical protein A2W25_05280 [candidate division Zixibacteria bacterium RBG_16_53_22]|nr:MAG: hypothetical protein A2W25_05280 [candidate division Zixibacteria bacterium RBG_16_53_22]
MAENGMNSITFPATNAAGEAKLKRLIETISDYMGSKVEIESVIVLQASYPHDRPDIEAIFKRLAGNKVGLVRAGQTKESSETKKEKPTDPISPAAPSS